MLSRYSDDLASTSINMAQSDFIASYFALAKRYHPDRNPSSVDLMANINVARTTILSFTGNQLENLVTVSVSRGPVNLSVVEEGS